mgnify:CR=1 FL=1
MELYRFSSYLHLKLENPTAAASATQIFLARFKQEALQFVPFSHFFGGSGRSWSSKKNFIKKDRVENH